MGGRILGHQTFMTLKETDDEKKIDKQWDILKTKIMQPNLALIFSQVRAVGCHRYGVTFNSLVGQGTHFALVFALREQKKSDGATIRSLLTANKVRASAPTATFSCHLPLLCYVWWRLSSEVGLSSAV